MVNRLPDYRLVEDYIDSPEAKRRAVAKKARQEAGQKAWAKKYGAEYARRKASNVITTQLSGPPTPRKLLKKSDGAFKGMHTPKPGSQGTFLSKATGPNLRKFENNKSINTIAGEVKPNKVKFKTDPSKYTAKYGLNTKAIKAVEEKSVTSFTADSVNMSVKEYSEYKLKNKTAQKTAKTIVKVAAKGATRLIPGIGTALLIKDVYDVNKWAMSQPKKKKKDANIYGTVSKNNIYKGY